ncbi:MAG: hypothetical protein GY756_15770 [bacterium]|nr:hypothetical protein [bacterium]
MNKPKLILFSSLMVLFSLFTAETIAAKNKKDRKAFLVYGITSATDRHVKDNDGTYYHMPEIIKSYEITEVNTNKRKYNKTYVIEYWKDNEGNGWQKGYLRKGRFIEVPKKNIENLENYNKNYIRYFRIFSNNDEKQARLFYGVIDLNNPIEIGEDQPFAVALALEGRSVAKDLGKTDRGWANTSEINATFKKEWTRLFNGNNNNIRETYSIMENDLINRGYIPTGIKPSF